MESPRRHINTNEETYDIALHTVRMVLGDRIFATRNVHDRAETARLQTNMSRYLSSQGGTTQREDGAGVDSGHVHI